MQIRILSGVVTSLGVQPSGAIVNLTDTEAIMLIRMGRAVPCQDDAPSPQNRDAIQVIKRGRKKV